MRGRWGSQSAQLRDGDREALQSDGEERKKAMDLFTQLKENTYDGEVCVSLETGGERGFYVAGHKIKGLLSWGSHYCITVSGQR